MPQLQCSTTASRVRTTTTTITMSPSVCVRLLLLLHLLVGGALGRTKATGEGRGMEKQVESRGGGVAMEEFMEEIRRAMSSQWEILQNIRYHILVTKVRVAQLETQVKKLTSQVEENTSQAPQLVHTGSEEPPPPPPPPLPPPAGGGGGGGGEPERGPPCPGETDAGVTLLVGAMRDLASAYNRLLNSTQTPGQVTSTAQDFGILTNIVDKMRNLSGIPAAPLPPAAATAAAAAADEDEMDSTTTTTTTTTVATTVVQGGGGGQGQGQEFGVNGPRILTKYSPNVTVEAGGTATLNCRILNLNDGAVFWYRDRDLSVMSMGTITYTSDTRFEAVNEGESGDWQLKIKEVQPSDEGWYDCVLISPADVSHKVWLAVVAPTPSPDADLGVESESTVFTFREGETATLACRVTDLGDATVSWTRSNGLELLTAGQHRLSPDPRFTAVQRGEDWLLQIEQVRKQDDGPYTCHVTTLTPTHYTFWLQVEDATTDPDHL